jgi:hypothetical protein
VDRLVGTRQVISILQQYRILTWKRCSMLAERVFLRDILGRP